MNNPEFFRLADSITDLAASIADLIQTQIKAAKLVAHSNDYHGFQMVPILPMLVGNDLDQPPSLFVRQMRLCQ
jgi:hypothetical protein